MAKGSLRLSTDKKNKSRVDYEPRSAHGRAVNKKLFRAYNRAFTKNNEAGLEGPIDFISAHVS